jgi:hypothetical protein
MKGAAFSTEHCQDLQRYCIWWRRVGSADRFRHWVLAESIDHAISRSRLDVSKALGTNTGLWKIEESEATDVGRTCEGPRRSSQRLGITAFVLLLLCLVFLLHWKSRAVASAESMESDDGSGIITPEIRSENNPTVWSWDGVIQSTKDH